MVSRAKIVRTNTTVKAARGLEDKQTAFQKARLDSGFGCVERARNSGRGVRSNITSKEKICMQARGGKTESKRL